MRLFSLSINLLTDIFVYRQMKTYLISKCCFQEENITILLDDGINTQPTKTNIMNAFSTLVQDCQQGDILLCQYAGKFQLTLGSWCFSRVHHVVSYDKMIYYLTHTSLINQNNNQGHGGSVITSSGGEGIF